MPPGRVRGWLARVSGWIDRDAELSLDELRRAYDLAKIPRAPVVVTPADREWLGFPD